MIFFLNHQTILSLQAPPFPSHSLLIQNSSLPSLLLLILTGISLQCWSFHMSLHPRKHTLSSLSSSTIPRITTQYITLIIIISGIYMTQRIIQGILVLILAKLSRILGIFKATFIIFISI